MDNWVLFQINVIPLEQNINFTSELLSSLIIQIQKQIIHHGPFLWLHVKEPISSFNG